MSSTQYVKEEESWKQCSKKRFVWHDECEIGVADEESHIQELRILGEGLGGEVGATVAFEIGGEVYVPIHDLSGHVRACVNMSGDVVEKLTYTAFGLESRTAHITPWTFSSKRQDEETGFLYFGRRFYEPSTATWLTQDPLGISAGPNLYAYVKNNPLTCCDLFGLEDQSNEGGGFWGGVWDSVCDAFSSSFNNFGQSIGEFDPSRIFPGGVGPCWPLSDTSNGPKNLTNNDQEEAARNARLGIAVGVVEGVIDTLEGIALMSGGSSNSRQISSSGQIAGDAVQELLQSDPNSPRYQNARQATSLAILIGPLLTGNWGALKGIGSASARTCRAAISAAAKNAAKAEAAAVKEIKRFHVKPASPEAVKHIVKGHLPSGKPIPGKTLFPKSWTHEQLMNNVNHLPNDIKTPWRISDRCGPSGAPRYLSEGILDGVYMRVVFEKGKGIVTAYPLQ
jgi:RHS repeat-associated protein